jgi:hypothetical protein
MVTILPEMRGRWIGSVKFERQEKEKDKEDE